MKWFLTLLGLVVLGFVFWTWDFSEPVIDWEPPPAIGKNFEISLDASDEGRGLLGIRVLLQQAGKSFVVYSQELETTAPWEKGRASEQVTVSAAELKDEVPLEEGILDIVVEVTDQPNLWLFSRKVTDVRTVIYDRTPPRVEVLSSQHYLRQGGSEAVAYRIFEDEVRSGVRVGDNTFYGYPTQGQEHLSLFALAHDQPADVPIRVWAEDRAGNRTETRFWTKTFPQKFRTSRINLNDRLIEAVSSDILANTTDVVEKESLVETFVEINDRYRDVTNQKLMAITSSSAARLLWDQPFLQLSNSKVESRFADYRLYIYEGKEIDRQTHLGFDLASVAQSPIEASNTGTVVHADYLGIYGNTVVLDHGMGLFSLYGHLSSIEVERGQQVVRGDTIGRTGQTGLAAGDHLHFSMILGETQVTPMEWWDPKWVQDHVLSKLETRPPQ